MKKLKNFQVKVINNNTSIKERMVQGQSTSHRRRHIEQYPQQMTSTRQDLNWAVEEKSRNYDPNLIYETGLRHHHLANTAYPIAHRKTIWGYRQHVDKHSELLSSAFSASPRMSLYLHIPFCERRCSYCEYAVVPKHDQEIELEYYLALNREIDLYDRILDLSSTVLVGFDIGGGTPSFIEAEKIIDLVNRVRSMFILDPGFSISIETTPKIAAREPEKLRLYYQNDIKRISMGLQMVNPRLLRSYGRDLNKIGYNRQAVDNIREAGFERFNIDLMYGFARQTINDFRHSLEYTIGLKPEYITLYRMRYKGTQVQSEADQIELDRIMSMYTMAYDVLTSAGYRSQPGKNTFSRLPGDHGTSRYLTERVIESTPYLGLGLGAQTFTNNILAYNMGAAEKKLKRYLKAIHEDRLPIQDLYLLPRAEAIAKMISVSFYFGQIDLPAFRRWFGIHLEQWFSREVLFVLEHNLMIYDGQVLRLTEKGAKVFNGVIALFYSDRVKQHLLSLD